MKLRYSRRALRQIHAISAYLDKQSHSASLEIAERIRDAIHMLLEFPEIGRHGSATGTRELIVPGLQYIVVYRIYRRAPREDEVRIAGIYHGAQLRPGQRRPSKR
jgi:plasmid stabilization system protein ParE